MYQHTQKGTLLRLLCGLMILVLLGIGWVFLKTAQSDGILMQREQDNLLRLWGILFIVLIMLALFHDLTVRVDENSIQLAYGIGIIRRRISMHQITAANATGNKWWYGWGIRMIPGGWMWNISGLSAVELKLKNGRLFRIGTDDPERLAATIRERLASS